MSLKKTAFYFSIIFFWVTVSCFEENDDVSLPNHFNSSESDDHFNDADEDDDEYEEEDTMFTNSAQCKNVNQYRSLNLCWIDCEDRRQQGGHSHGIEMGNASSARYPYKLIDLNKNEFEIHNGRLTTTSDGRTFNETTFWTDGEAAHLCYPMSKHFVRCDQIFFEEHEVDLRDNSRALWIDAEKMFYNVDEFMVEREKDDILYWVCVSSTVDNPATIVFLVGWIISTISLIVFFALSLTITKLNMYMNSPLLAHIAMLTAAYFMLVLEHIVTERSQVGCVIWSAFRQFFFLSAFFWMNVVAGDLCFKLSSMRVHNTLSRLSQRRQFCYYGCYAWGGALLISIATVFVEVYAPRESTLWPGFQTQCWFRADTRLVLLLYFYSPIAIVLIMNVIFFVITTLSLIRSSQDVRRVNKEHTRQMFIITCKLLVVMGIFWTMEVISWAVGGHDDYWHLFDAINSFQGLFIFVIYLCKRTYYRMLVCRVQILLVKWKCVQNDANGVNPDIMMSTFNKNSDVSNTMSVSVQSSSGEANPLNRRPSHLAPDIA